MIELTLDQQRAIVRAYKGLRDAINQGATEADLRARFEVFKRAYQGSLTAVINAFPSTPDRLEWARDVHLRLTDEIAEPTVWTDDD